MQLNEVFEIYFGGRPWWPIQSPTKKTEESKRLRGERDQIKFIDLGFERWQVVRFRKAKDGKTFHKLHVLGMNGDLWDEVRALGSETWKGCE